MLNKPNELTDASLDGFLAAAKLPVLIDLWAPWCAPCRTMSPIIDKLAKNSAGKLLVAKIDVEKYPAIMARFGVRGIPTLLLFKGEAQPERQMGALSQGQLISWLAGHKVDLTSQPTVQHDEALEWASFYGDEELHDFIARRAIGHAAAGDISMGLGSFWIDGKGSASAAMVHQAENHAFERITGLPIAIGRLLDICGYLTAEQMDALFAALRAGKDYRLAPLRFMHWWFSEESAPWASYFRDPQLARLLERWRALCADRLAGRETSPDAWATVGEQAILLQQGYQGPDRQLEQLFATLLQLLSPVPVTTEGDKWGHIAINIHWAQFQHLEILSGWSDEDRATPGKRIRWFREQERKTSTGKLNQEEIAELRAVWEAENAEFLAKENVFHQSILQLFLPVKARMQQELNRLLAEAPEF
ncbi:thiol reductase thioredoxin [Brenneria izadpanahii]|uniref:Thiol reductase thioredoxin n=1 Tax=Brenneria izadpanahii TaxID=2722756 RepID=A0ABX7UWZ3_9GAMM|nr:thioredoxin domain-containing protein [Brenneria izadpanahii]QTF09122.1 thiol reductase thioredoxin [Brenneria izadpanahii]